MRLRYELAILVEILYNVADCAGWLVRFWSSGVLASWFHLCSELSLLRALLDLTDIAVVS